ncbi:MAG: dihydroxyacetone kinase subunit DhaL [Deinococcota bacterium]
MSIQVVQTIFQNILEVISAKEDELGKLDAVAGDGDHGIGMVRGLKAAHKTVQDANTMSPSQLISDAGASFSDAAGGSSGALVGILMITTGNKLQDDNMDTAHVAQALELGLTRMCKLGKSGPGQKTMIDTLDPFITSLKTFANKSLSDGWQAALPAAEDGMNATATMTSQKGRAAKLGERSKGHKDPGAVSMFYMLETVGEVLKSA